MSVERVRTPYVALRALRGTRADWWPRWAQNRQVWSTEGRTEYVARPSMLDARGLEDLRLLEGDGWAVSLDTEDGRLVVTMTAAEA